MPHLKCPVDGYTPLGQSPVPVKYSILDSRCFGDTDPVPSLLVQITSEHYCAKCGINVVVTESAVYKLSEAEPTKAVITDTTGFKPKEVGRWQPGR